MNREQLKQYITETYHTNADYPWTNSPNDMVFRHQNNRKWFALVMKISKRKLGLSDEGLIDILNVKCEPDLIGSLREESGIFPAYHMNKTNWLTIALDGSVSDEKIKWLLDISYDLTKIKIKNNNTDHSCTK